MLIPIYQKIPRHLWISSAEIKRKAISFRIPIRTATILLTRESLRSNIQSFIFTSIRLHHLENIEPDPLLCGNIPFNGNITFLPLAMPYHRMLFKQLIKSFDKSFIQFGLAYFNQSIFGMVLRR